MKHIDNLIDGKKTTKSVNVQKFANINQIAWKTFSCNFESLNKCSDALFAQMQHI